MCHWYTLLVSVLSPPLFYLLSFFFFFFVVLHFFLLFFFLLLSMCQLFNELNNPVSLNWKTKNLHKLFCFRSHFLSFQFPVRFDSNRLKLELEIVRPTIHACVRSIFFSFICWRCFVLMQIIDKNFHWIDVACHRFDGLRWMVCHIAVHTFEIDINEMSVWFLKTNEVEKREKTWITMNLCYCARWYSIIEKITVTCK